MDIKIHLRDRRDAGWYYINNEVYDAAPSCEALALYNAIARFANNKTEKAYFSGKKWKRHHKVGHAKLAEAMRWLLEKKLIAPTGQRTAVGAVYFELLSTNHLKPYSEAEQGAIPRQNTGGSKAEQGGVPRRNTNHTRNNTKNKDKKAKAVSKADTPSLMRRVTDLIGEAHKHLTGEKLEWIGRQKAYGAAMSDILKSVKDAGDEEAQFQAVRAKCQAYYQKAKVDEFYRSQGITPISLRSAWNKIQSKPVKESNSFQPKAFPDYRSMTVQEIKDTFTKWNKKFNSFDLQEHLSPESYKRFIHEAQGYAPALVDILIEEVHGKKISA